MTDPLALFRAMAETVPAYQDFLREQGVDPGAVRTLGQIPLMTKQNYHLRYGLERRCPGGSLRGADMVAVSSGSSGRPTVWPRSIRDELVVAERFEQVLVGGFRAGSAAPWR